LFSLESVHQLECTGFCLGTAFDFSIDVNLGEMCERHVRYKYLRAVPAERYYSTYNGSVKLVQVLPSALVSRHDIDFVVLERLTIPYSGKHHLGIIAEGAIWTSE